MNGDVAHGLGAAGALLAGAAYVALAVAGRRRARLVRGRAAVVAGVRAEPSWGWGRAREAVGRAALRGWVLRWGAPLGAVVTGWVLLGGPFGALAGVAGGYGVWWWQRGRTGVGAGSGTGERAGAGRSGVVGESRAGRSGVVGETGGFGDQLPLAADLLAACASAGAGPGEAADAVGESLGGPVGARLVRVAAELRLGGEPADAWGRFGEATGAYGLARCLERACSTGAPSAEPVSRVAERLRAERAREATARAQRAGVLITAPVGLCFLPAFLAVGVVPVLIGLASGLLRGQ
ncbi:type II secretion system F family protein [Streptomyces sp. NPDC050504]|uniref:type II secretion system F family protein n=1 Tax=Streptomyces sp. NPDC050504 TaxID=3365618 RepID=UPI0037918B5A